MTRFCVGLLMGLLWIPFQFSCDGSGPHVTVYISDPASGGMQYYDAQGNKGFVPYSVTSNFIALSPTDAEIIFNYCGLSSKN